MAGVDRTKRALLITGRSRPRTPLTPPWALPIERFTDACTRCGDCIAACPEHILASGDGGFPTVNFRENACTFCRACVTACPTGALSPEVSPVWPQVARPTSTCLTLQGVHCQSCRDACPVDAVRFKPTLGRVPQPTIDLDRCTGCGACVAPCPANAIEIIRKEQHA